MRPADFVEARQRLEARRKDAGEKVMDGSAAARLVKDGDHVAVGGCLFSRTPMLLVREILRQRRTRLSLSRSLMCFEGEMMMVAGAVESVVTSWLGIGLPWGISRVMRHYVESGEIAYQEWSHLGLGLRYRAAAMGIPFLPTLTMLGSDITGAGLAKQMACPFTGETVNLMPALFPDVAILHVHRADRFGNCQIDGYSHMDADIARAASIVLVTAEEIIDEEVTRRQADRTVIPGFVVDAVVEAPLGAFPGECYGLYETDFAHFDSYVDGINEKGLDGVRDYLERYVYGPTSHADYLALFDPELIERQRRAARDLVNPRLRGR